MRRYCIDEKLEKELSNYKVYCKNCGHTLYFYPCDEKDKKICSWCKHTVYKNDVAEFKDKLKNQERKIKNEK